MKSVGSTKDYETKTSETTHHPRWISRQTQVYTGQLHTLCVLRHFFRGAQFFDVQIDTEDGDYERDSVNRPVTEKSKYYFLHPSCVSPLKVDVLDMLGRS